MSGLRQCDPAHDPGQTAEVGDGGSGAAGQILVRPARADEFDRIGQVAVAAYRADHAELLRDEDGYLAELADAAGRARDAELLVAVDPDERVVGTVMIVLPGTRHAEVCRDGELEFRMLAVDPAARRRGIGRQLTDAVLRRARSAGARRVVLCMLDTNESARRLYERMGFRRMPERDWQVNDEIALIAYGIDPGERTGADGIVVRPALPAEWDRVAELTVAAYAADSERMRPGQGYAVRLADTEGRARDGELLVAVGAGEHILGTVTVIQPGSPLAQLAKPGEVEFRMLAVDPAARGRGVGERLTTAVIDRATAIGASRVVLFTVERMRVAQRIYRRLGFRRAPERDWLREGERPPLLAYTLDL